MTQLYHTGNQQTTFTQLSLFVLSKVCTSCNTEKAIESFEQDRNQCKDCRREYRRVHRLKTYYTSEAKEARQRYQSTPEYKKRNLERSKRFTQTPEGKEYHRQYSRKQNKTAKRQEFERQRRQDPKYLQWRSDYFARTDIKLHINAIRRERYATETSYALRRREEGDRRNAQKAQTKVEQVDYKAILEENNGFCYICNKAILSHHEIDFDHIIPLARKGPHTKENIAVTHATCNRRKRHKLFSEMSDFDRRGPDN